jgi:hypothetical protein
VIKQGNLQHAWQARDWRAVLFRGGQPWALVWGVMKPRLCYKVRRVCLYKTDILWKNKKKERGGGSKNRTVEVLLCFLLQRTVSLERHALRHRWRPVCTTWNSHY